MYHFDLKKQVNMLTILFQQFIKEIKKKKTSISEIREFIFSFLYTLRYLLNFYKNINIIIRLDISRLKIQRIV